MSENVSPKTVLLFVMNSKGGVGKSYFTYCLVQAFKFLGVKNLEVIEADPETLTITRSLGKENVSDIRLADYNEEKKTMRLKQDSFDEVIDLVGAAADENQNGVVIVDVGSNLYTQAVEYMREINIEKTVQEAGAEFWIGSVAYMSTMDAVSTCASIEDLCSTFHNVLVMDNRYNGDARDEFEITDELDPVEVIKYPFVSPQIIEAAQVAMSTDGISSIHQASTSSDIKFSKRSWLKQLQELLFSSEKGIFTNSEVVKRIADIGNGKEVPSIVDFHSSARKALSGKQSKSEKE